MKRHGFSPCRNFYMCQILIYSNQRKAELYLNKKYLRESKNILAELFSTGEIDRIDEIK